MMLAPHSLRNVDHHDTEQGFTLIELSIVLVIIGLIVGGVLVGQDLIKASEVRATIGQIEKYNASVNTFRTRFGGVPGDIASGTAANFGMATRNGGTGRGDGNGLIDGSGGDAMIACGETLLFWRDLSFANLIDGSYTSATDTALASCPTVASGFQSSYFPPAKLGKGTYVTVFTTSGLNYYQIAGITSTDANGDYTLTAPITPNEGFNMDNKVDDGFPLTGQVQAKYSLSALNATPTPASDECVSDATGNPYNTVSAYANTQLCQMTFRMN